MADLHWSRLRRLLESKLNCHNHLSPNHFSEYYQWIQIVHLGLVNEKPLSNCLWLVLTRENLIPREEIYVKREYAAKVLQELPRLPSTEADLAIFSTTVLTHFPTRESRPGRPSEIHNCPTRKFVFTPLFPNPASCISKEFTTYPWLLQC